jgi:hypothetical protein
MHLLAGVAGFMAAVLLIDYATSRVIDRAEVPKGASSETGRGRSAAVPSEIPLYGWKDIDLPPKKWTGLSCF